MAMVSGVVQFREDEAELAFLRAHGVNPNELAREAFEHALRVVHAKVRAERIREFRQMIRIPEDVDITALIREDRDTDHGRNRR